MRNGLGLFFSRRGYFFIPPLTDPKAYAARMMQQGIFTRAARTVRACMPTCHYYAPPKFYFSNITNKARGILMKGSGADPRKVFMEHLQLGLQLHPKNFFFFSLYFILFYFIMYCWGGGIRSCKLTAER